MFHYFGWVSWISSRSTWLKIPVRSDNNIRPGNRSSPVTGRANMKRPWKDNVYSLKIIRKLCHWIDFNSLHILGSGYFFFFFLLFFGKNEHMVFPLRTREARTQPLSSCSTDTCQLTIVVLLIFQFLPYFSTLNIYILWRFWIPIWVGNLTSRATYIC